MHLWEAKDFFVSQASLTGESEPIEKVPHTNPQKESVTDYTNLAFMGSNVISGSASAVVVCVGDHTLFGQMASAVAKVVVCVGDHTLFGQMASAVAKEAVETSFTKGVNAVSWVLIRFMMIMVPLVFVVNGITKGDWLKAFLFGISIAVGLTPEMLPMIVTTCLAKGAVSMSKKQTIVKNLNSIQNFGAVGLTPEMLPMIVTTCLAKGAVSMSKKQTIVKNLNSIQNFGAMDILCTDKTGTLTQDKVVLEYHFNVN